MAKIRKNIGAKTPNSVPVKMRTLNNCVKESLIDNNVVSFRDIQDKLVTIYAKKNHDYGDSFNQGCDELGVGYAFSRIYDKTKRFQTLAKGIMNNSFSLEVQDETIDDTLMDLANYCVMYFAWKGYTDNKGYCPGEVSINDGIMFIDISTNLKNGIIKHVQEKTGKDCTKEVIKQYGYTIVKDNDNYVYIETYDKEMVSVTNEDYLVKVVPNK